MKCCKVVRDICRKVLRHLSVSTMFPPRAELLPPDASTTPPQVVQFFCEEDVICPEGRLCLSRIVRLVVRLRPVSISFRPVRPISINSYDDLLLFRNISIRAALIPISSANSPYPQKPPSSTTNFSIQPSIFHQSRPDLIPNIRIPPGLE